MDKVNHLKDSGLKVTGPRLKILDLFENCTDCHLSAEDIYRMLLDDAADVGLATIYRVLTQFEQAGILVRHHFESGKSVFELAGGGHHDHIVCISCNKVAEFFSKEIEILQEKIAHEYGYSVVDHALYMYGLCSDCQKNNA